MPERNRPDKKFVTGDSMTINLIVNYEKPDGTDKRTITIPIRLSDHWEVQQAVKAGCYFTNIKMVTS
jgi:hypothetical protein